VFGAARNNDGLAGNLWMMAAGDAHLRPRVIAVGSRRSGFMKEMARLAGEYDLAIAACDDVYCAALELARDTGRCLMVAGMFRELARRKGDFFALAERKGVRCCCLLDRDGDVEREKILAAVRAGVHLAGEAADVRQFLEDQLAAERHRFAGGEQEDLFSEPFRASEAEITALLRQNNA
jgi:hypothetical protein